MALFLKRNSLQLDKGESQLFGLFQRVVISQLPGLSIEIVEEVKRIQQQQQILLKLLLADMFICRQEIDALFGPGYQLPK